MIEYEDLLDIPYKHNGRDKNGIDCYGLVVEVFKRYGIKVPEYQAPYHDYKKINDLYMEDTNNGIWEKTHYTETAPPLAVAMRLGSSVVNHIGVYIGDNKIIHCTENFNVSVFDNTSPQFKRLIVGYYKLRGVQ